MALLVLVSAGTGVGYITLKPRADHLQAAITADLQAGQRELVAGKTSLTQANSKHDATMVGQAIAHFVAAKGQFLVAGQLADNSSLLHDLELLPGVGSLARSRHATVAGIAEMGVALSDAGRDLSTFDSELIKPAPAGQPGRNLLTVLNEAQPTVLEVRGDLQRAQNGASKVNVAVIPASQQATFVKARDGIASALAGLDEFDRLMPVLTDVLGGNGARTYLVAQLNPAELRPGGGFIGTYSLINAAHGALTLMKSGNAYDLANPRPELGQTGFIPQPSPYRETAPTVSWSFVDSNIYADFPSNAKIAESFAQPRIGMVDGVIAMDYYTVAEMLSLTGPVTIPGFGTLTASNFISSLIPLDLVNSTNHKAVVAEVAAVLMQRLAALPSAQWPGLIVSLNTLVAQRHLQAYFNNATVETEINRVGWSGTVMPTDATDFMMEVEANYWGNKNNYFLARSFSLDLTRIGPLLHHVLTVNLVNGTACGSADRPSYRADFQLFVAETATAVSDNLRPVQYANPPPPTGTRAADGWAADVGCDGGRGQAIFTYDTPWATSVGEAAQIYWQKQPGTGADAIAIKWHDGDGHSYTTSGTLDQDRVISISASGVFLTPGQPAQVNLSSLSLG